MTMAFTVYVDARTLPLATIGPDGPYEHCAWREWLSSHECVYVAAEVEMPAHEGRRTIAYSTPCAFIARAARKGNRT